jgi:hypothetical protein
MRGVFLLFGIAGCWNSFINEVTFRALFPEGTGVDQTPISFEKISMLENATKIPSFITRSELLQDFRFLESMAPQKLSNTEYYIEILKYKALIVTSLDANTLKPSEGVYLLNSFMGAFSRHMIISWDIISVENRVILQELLWFLGVLLQKWYRLPARLSIQVFDLEEYQALNNFFIKTEPQGEYKLPEVLTSDHFPYFSNLMKQFIHKRAKDTIPKSYTPEQKNQVFQSNLSQLLPFYDRFVEESKVAIGFMTKVSTLSNWMTAYTKIDQVQKANPLGNVPSLDYANIAVLSPFPYGPFDCSKEDAMRTYFYHHRLIDAQFRIHEERLQRFRVPKNLNEFILSLLQIGFAFSSNAIRVLFWPDNTYLGKVLHNHLVSRYNHLITLSAPDKPRTKYLAENYSKLSINFLEGFKDLTPQRIALEHQLFNLTYTFFSYKEPPSFITLRQLLKELRAKVELILKDFNLDPRNFESLLLYLEFYLYALPQLGRPLEPSWLVDRKIRRSIYLFIIYGLSNPALIASLRAQLMYDVQRSGDSVKDFLATLAFLDQLYRPKE